MSFNVKSTSPDGRFQVRVDAWEARNSLWVDSPSLRDTKTDKTLLQFASEMWSLDRDEWTANDLVIFTIRRYPGNHAPAQLVVRIDCMNQTAELESLQPVPLSELEELLERRLLWK